MKTVSIPDCPCGGRPEFNNEVKEGVLCVRLACGCGRHSGTLMSRTFSDEPQLKVIAIDGWRRTY